MTYLEVLNQKYGVALNPTMQATLTNFDPKAEYGGNHEGYKLSSTSHRILVGMSTNLIREISDAGASDAELIRAIKYSLVVVDTVKHGLDYKQAEVDFGISELYEKYHKNKRNSSN